MDRTTIISAQPGFELVIASSRSGAVFTCPVIGWRVGEDGGATYRLLPIIPHRVQNDPAMCYGVRWPDGRLCCVDTSLVYPSVEEWLFDVRASAATHEHVGSA
jgi:hypothetical protein